MTELTTFEGQKNFLGWPFLDFETTDNIVEITKYRLQFLFSVMKGERMGNIRYGSSLWKRVFNQLTNTERVIIKTEILQTLKEQMPYLFIRDVEVDESSQTGQAIITIAFIIPKYDNIEATFRIAI
jgi:phage baseplate assembly protein W